MANRESWQQEMLDRIRPYPCTIVKDRYGGTYSHAEWLAFELDCSEIPEEVGGDDVDEMNFFDVTEIIIGKGDTPNEAYEDLKSKLRGIMEGEDE